MEENVNTRLSPELSVDISLDRNLENIKIYTDNSSDVIIKTGMVCGNRLAVLTDRKSVV